MLEILNYTLFFLIGTVFASFLNLCVYRIEEEFSLKDILYGKSMCEKCKKELSWLELIPIVSFLFLRGKCSSCKKSISWFNPISEILLGLCFMFFYAYGLPYSFFLFLLIFYFWGVYDFFYKSIPKNITDFIFALSLIYWVVLLFYDFDWLRVYPVILALIIALLVFVLSFKKKVFGLGDVIVFFIMAFWFDLIFFANTLLYSILIGGLFGILLVLKDKKYFKKYVPFLPFVFFGFLLSVFLETRNLGIFLFDYIPLVW